MAYNYTISEYVFTEAVTDAVYAGNMVSGGTMTITPNSGYVVSASSFSGPDTLPAQFASIAFTDTTTAGEIGNTVTVTFTFSTLFEMEPGLSTITIPITGHADLIDEKRDISISIDFIDNTIENVNGETAVGVFSGVASTVTETPETETIDSNGLQTSNLSGTIDAENNIAIATILVNADSNFHFDNLPTISVENAPQGASFSLQLTDTVLENSNNQPTHLSYKLKVNSSVSIPSGLACKVFIHYTGVADVSSTKEIKEIIYGSPEIPIGGTTKRIKIVGDVGAEFDLTITKNSDNTSIMSTDLANADIIHIPAGLIRGLNKTLTSSNTGQLFESFEFDQIFPSASANEIYHINVTPKGSTILNANLTQAAPQAIIYQYINPTVTFNTDAGTNYTVTSKTALSIIGRPNKKPGRLKHIKTIKEIYSFTYVYTKGAHGTKFTTTDLPVWSMTDASSDWDQSTTNHGNIVEIINITLSKNDETTPTVITVTGDIIIRKFGTANVTFNLDSSEFLAIT